MDIRSGASDGIPLGRIIDEIGEFDDELIVCAPTGVQVTPETPVYLVDEENEEPPAGTEYVLELFLMKNVLKVWSAWRNGAMPTIPQACEAVLHYAKYDAYLPVSGPETGRYAKTGSLISLCVFRHPERSSMARCEQPG